MARPNRSDADEAKSHAAMRALVELFENVKEKPQPCRRYQLEQVDGELILRQTEIDAAIENALASLEGHPSNPARRVIRLDEVCPPAGTLTLAVPGAESKPTPTDSETVMASNKRGNSGPRKETSQRVSSVAAKGLRTGKLTPKETRTVSASALGQDETKGPRKK